MKNPDLDAIMTELRDASRALTHNRHDDDPIVRFANATEAFAEHVLDSNRGPDEDPEIIFEGELTAATAAAAAPSSTVTAGTCPTCHRPL